MLKNILKVFLIVSCVASATLIIYGQVQCNGSQVFSEKSCAGDQMSEDEQVLFDIVNKYRAANGQTTAKFSSSLSMVANRHLIDLRINVKSFTHSWSNCPYDIKNDKTWPCIIDAPKRLKSGYSGQGYETLYVTSTGKATPQLALEAWKKSALHNSIILNRDIFKDLPWEEIGVAIDGNYAALWFGTSKRSGSSFGDGGSGIGVTYDQAINGLSKTIPIKLSSSTIENNRWQGISADKKIIFEISGAKANLNEAKMTVTSSLEADGKLSDKNFEALSTLLGNIFPEWADREVWLRNTLKLIGADHTTSRTKVVRKVFVQLKNGAGNTVQLLFSPESGRRAIEIF